MPPSPTQAKLPDPILGRAIGFAVSATLAIAIVGLFAVLHAAYSSRPTALVSGALQIEPIPASVHDARCKSWGATDVLTTCSFKLKAQDFPRLLAGLHWTVKPASGGSYSYGSGPHVGSEFPVTTEYDAAPLDAPNGGLVRLVTDATHTRAQVDLYIE